MATLEITVQECARRLGLILTGLRRTRLWQAMAAAQPVHPLAGDRCVEWEWVTRHLPAVPARVLDVGCVDSITAGLAAVRGLQVTGVDIRANPFRVPGLEFLRGSVVDVRLDDEGYDCVVVCSTLEHIGLPGRYGEVEARTGDRKAMCRLIASMKADARMIVTIPVGRSSVFAPYHRIYGESDTVNLFEGLSAVESDYWRKTGAEWRRVASDVAYDTVGSSEYYAIGLFLLARTAVTDSA